MYKREVFAKGRKYYFYYHNIRENGKIRNVCLGSDLRKAKKKLAELNKKKENTKFFDFFKFSNKHLMLILILVGMISVFYILQDRFNITGFSTAGYEIEAVGAGSEVFQYSAFNGTTYADSFGWSVASGDVNGDNYTDTIIGAYAADPPSGSAAGQVYVFFGAEFTENIDPVQNASEYANITLNGTYVGGQLGISVASGDVNNDGYADVIVGANKAHIVSTNDEGQVYVFFGADFGTTVINENALEYSNITFNGTKTSDYLGRSVATGDVNNDGYADVIVGADYADTPGQADAGQAYLFFGDSYPDTSAGISYNALMHANITLNGTLASDYLGQSVASGDINNDSYDDIIVGTDLADPSGTSSGQAYLFFGDSYPDTSAGISYNVLRDANITFNGTLAGDKLGRSVATGDINNDNYTDVIIGAYGTSVYSTSQEYGQVYVFFGDEYSNAAPGSVSYNALINANVTLNGSVLSDYLGWSISSGDVNNDGYADVITGVLGGDPPGQADAGQVYVFYGADYTETTGLTRLNASIILNGTKASDYFGRSVATGDVNNDGYADVIVGANQMNTAMTLFYGAGYAYVFYITDTVAPVIGLELPADNATNKTANDIDFTYNVTDALSLVNCSLLIENSGGDLSINVTDTAMLKDTIGQNLTTYLFNGEYNWTINCTDLSNNIGTSETRNISIRYGEAETAPPTVNLELPEDNATNLTANTIDFTYNVTEDSTLINCSLIIENSGGDTSINVTDTEMLKDTAGQNLTTYLFNGEYNWTVNCTDEFNNIGTSDIKNLSIDATILQCDSCENCNTLITSANPGDTVTLTANISDVDGSCIFITEKDSVTFDCAGNIIDGDNDDSGHGIDINRSSQLNISNCEIREFSVGVYIWGEGSDPSYKVNNSEFSNLNISHNTNYGLYTYFMLNTTWDSIIADNNSVSGIYMYLSNTNVFNNLSASENGQYGLYLYMTQNNIIENATLVDNQRYDMYVDTTGTAYCNNIIQNITSSGGREIVFANGSVSLENSDLAEVLLCNADYSNLTNITVIGSDNYYNNAIVLTYADYCNLSGINSSYNYYGIDGYTSETATANNLFENVEANNNLLDGISIWGSTDTFTNITANNNGRDGIDVGVAGGGDDYINMSEITANGNSEAGIYYYNCDYIIITNATCNFNKYGIYGADDSLYPSYYGTIENVITSNNSDYGMYLVGCFYSNISNLNSTENSKYGLYLYGSHNNTITLSRFENNSQAGVYTKKLITSSLDNLFYNNFFNNSGTYGNIYMTNDATGTNFFNTTLDCTQTNIISGPCIGGNYWTYENGTGFSDECLDINVDGICDSNYNVSSGTLEGYDYLPLSGNVLIYLELPEDNATNTTTNTIDFTYNLTGGVYDLVNCSLMIENSGGDLSRNVTDTAMQKDISGQNLTTYLTNGEYNWTINCTDISNNIGSSETRNISVGLICDNCSNCNTLISAANAGNTITLQNNITDTVGDCISFSGKNNITFDCAGFTIDGDGLATDYGIVFSSTAENNTIGNCTITNFNDGISVPSNNNGNHIINVTAMENSGDGLDIRSSFNTIEDSLSHDNTDNGILIMGPDNVVVNVTLLANSQGAMIAQSATGTNLTNSTIENNTAYGIYIYTFGDYGVIYNNMLLNNTISARADISTVDYWNTTKTSGENVIGGPNIGGNSWSDYDGSDDDNDGIGEEPYYIVGTGFDYLPLTTQAANPPLVLIVSPNLTTYSTSSVALDYVAIDAEDHLDAVWYTKDSGVTNTTLTQNITLSSLSNADYTLILYANDTFGNLNETNVTFTVAVPSSTTESPGGTAHHPGRETTPPSAPTPTPVPTPTPTPTLEPTLGQIPITPEGSLLLDMFGISSPEDVISAEEARYELVNIESTIFGEGIKIDLIGIKNEVEDAITLYAVVDDNKPKFVINFDGEECDYDCPNCYDNVKDGDEEGVDCGGSCALNCQGEKQLQKVVFVCGDGICGVGEECFCSKDCGRLECMKITFDLEGFLSWILVFMLSCVFFIPFKGMYKNFKEPYFDFNKVLKDTVAVKQINNVNALLKIFQTQLGNKQFKEAAKTYLKLRVAYKTLHGEDKKYLYPRIMSVATKTVIKKLNKYSRGNAK